MSCTGRTGWMPAVAGLGSLAFLLIHSAAARGAETPVSTQALKQLSFEELMSLEVTTVSRQAEKLSEAASAIQVITGEDIRRSGATSIAEALRLAPNLQVAQVNSSQWAISARGFNNVLANKLLVLIDGRTVYTPFYAGVFWDVQDVLLEDVERIEVVSGPGSTLWGANAVNGVINIITKAAHETQGAYVTAGAGGELDGLAGLRYGGKLKSGAAWRVYGKTTHRDDTLGHADGEPANDDWELTQGGMRVDWSSQSNDSYTLQADLYDGESNPDGNANVKTDGGSVMGRWKRVLTAGSDLQVQVYFDHATRDFGNGFAEALSTWDFDAQHSLLLAERHQVIWGVGVRLMRHAVDNLPLFGFTPEDKTLHLYSAFVQDEIELRNDFASDAGHKVRAQRLYRLRVAAQRASRLERRASTDVVGGNLTRRANTVAPRPGICGVSAPRLAAFDGQPHVRVRGSGGYRARLAHAGFRPILAFRGDFL